MREQGAPQVRTAGAQAMQARRTMAEEAPQVRAMQARGTMAQRAPQVRTAAARAAMVAQAEVQEAPQV